MGRPYEATEALLTERPELEETVERLVVLDADGPWSFDDVDCDSGTFGEVVSRDFVGSVDDGYRLVDREETRAALAAESAGEDTGTDETAQNDTGTGEADDEPRGDRTSPLEQLKTTVVGGTGGGRLEDQNRSFLVSMGLALAFLFLMRSVLYRQVFRGDHIVLPGNDPYHYRFWVDRLLASDLGLFELGGIGDLVGGETFTYVLGWWLTVLLQGDPATSGIVIAWLPVVVTLFAAVLVAWMALSVTGDERIAVLSVVFLAVTPGHAQYTLVGFFDHHPIDGLWLAAMAATLVWLARDSNSRTDSDHLRTPRTWLVTAAFGLVCTAAMMTWSGAPVLLGGIAVYVTLRAISDVRSADSPLLTALPVLVGLGLATVLGHLFQTLGWQEPAVAYAPGVVLLGALGVAGFAELVDRVYADPRVAATGTAVVGGLSAVVVMLLAPSIWNRYVNRFQESLLGRRGIAETRGLLDLSFLFGLGPVQQFGLLLFFAVPALVYVSWRCLETHDPAWLVFVGHGWAMFAFVCVQVRFVNEFAPFGAIFAAVGFFGALSWADVSRPVEFARDHRRLLRIRDSIRSPNRTVYVSFVFVVVVTIGIFATIAAMGVLTIDDEEYEAAAWIADDSDEERPFVMSRWGRNRMYNYLAWGGGDDYGYALVYNSEFLTDSDPDDWGEQFLDPGATPYLDRPVSYVVIGDLGVEQVSPDTTYNKLFFEYGSAFEYDNQTELGTETVRTDGVGHFRLVYLTETGQQAVFEPVPGARLVGETQSNTTVAVETNVSVAGESFTYTRRTTSNETGQFALSVSYVGNYTLPDGSTVNVTETDVTDGATVRSASDGVPARHRLAHSRSVIAWMTGTTNSPTPEKYERRAASRKTVPAAQARPTATPAGRSNRSVNP